jgi:hypothetical protein
VPSVGSLFARKLRKQVKFVSTCFCLGKFFQDDNILLQYSPSLVLNENKVPELKLMLKKKMASCVVGLKKGWDLVF